MAQRMAQGLLLGCALAASAGPAWAGATTKLVSVGMGGVPADGGSGALSYSLRFGLWSRPRGRSGSRAC